MRTLNQYLQVENSPISTLNRISPLQSLDTIDLQQSRIKVTNITYDNPIKYSLSAGTFALNDGVSVYFSSDLQWNSPRAQEPIFGIPSFAIYATAAATGSMQIYPDLGVGITSTDFPLEHGFNSDTYRGYDRSNLEWLFRMTNSSGTNITFYYNLEWRYFQFFDVEAND